MNFCISYQFYLTSTQQLNGPISAEMRFELLLKSLTAVTSTFGGTKKRSVKLTIWNIRWCRWWTKDRLIHVFYFPISFGLQYQPPSLFIVSCTIYGKSNGGWGLLVVPTLVPTAFSSSKKCGFVLEVGKLVCFSNKWNPSSHTPPPRPFRTSRCHRTLDTFAKEVESTGHSNALTRIFDS